VTKDVKSNVQLSDIKLAGDQSRPARGNVITDHVIRFSATYIQSSNAIGKKETWLNLRAGKDDHGNIFYFLYQMYSIVEYVVAILLEL
jgi:hypothetical protein